MFLRVHSSWIKHGEYLDIRATLRCLELCAAFIIIDFYHIFCTKP